MTKKMLIDATHAEETRVAVVEGNRLVDFDYESQLRKQLKGSIFLAKVTRVEPSLQAAFVNFGGNRHGFLPFNEIHPDYFRIPIADREALIAAQQAEIEALRAQEEAEDEEEEEQGPTDQNEEAENDEAEDAVEEIGGEDAVARDEEDDDEGGNGNEDEAEADAEAEAEAETETEGGEIVEIAAAQQGKEITELQPIDDFTGNHDAEAQEVMQSSGDTQDTEADDQQPEPGNEREQEPVDADGNNRNNRGDRGGRYRGRGRGGRDRGRGRMQARSRRFEKYGDDEGDGQGLPGKRHYKIQEVIKRGQIMLVQVSREERGNKGAAVTTNLSLPGRYCVLMPNSQRGGGVSRKVASFQERRRMREMLTELKVPEGMSVIMRTAGVSRTKPEIKRDLDYLLKLWDSIRELTLKSTAPALVHEEGQLIRRAVRDIYGPEIDEIEVAGEEGYKLAKEYMKMMIPSHVKHVHHYTDEKIPLFHRYQVESQISSMSEPSVTLRSGGYLVINPTEALISIDVNSGRATRERHIEETALKTNLEAAEEVARQLRLRDLGGLVVIDFIDMEDRRNNRKVENRLRDALSSDRARIQIGRISSFGLLELSRQRLNPSLTEAQFERCSHCKGVGHVRTIDMTAITALRALEEEGIRERAAEVALHVPDSVALYILNNKRAIIADIERRYGFRVTIKNDETLAPAGFRVEPLRTADGQPVIITEDEKMAEQQAAPEHRHHHHRGEGEGQGQGQGRGGRRRGRRGGRGRGRDRFDGEGQGRNDFRKQDDRGAGDHEDGLNPSDSPMEDGELSPADHDNADNQEDNADNRGNRADMGDDHGNPSGDRDRDRNRGGRRRGRRGGRGRGRGRGRDRFDGEGSHNDGGNRHGNFNHRDNDGNRPAATAGDDNQGRGNNRPYDHGNSQAVEQPSYREPREQSREREQPAAIAAQEKSAASNANEAKAPAPPRDYERVNEPPVSKKKGWWNRLTE